MKQLPRLTLLAVLSALAVALVAGACSKEGGDSTKRVEELEAKLEDQEQRLAKVEKFLQPFMNQPPPPPEPDPAAVYAVPIEGAPYKGPESAPVTIVEAFEFACPYCRRVHPTIEQLLQDYEGKVKVVYKQYIVHPDVATVPALASCAAALQGKFAPMEKLIWEKGFEERDLSREKMLALAKEVGLDKKKFEADMDGEVCKTRVQQDQQQLAQFGVNGTPGFFINGRFLGGAQPIGAFKKIIDEELAKAEKRIAGGLPVEQYYAKAVLEEGKKSLE